MLVLRRKEGAVGVEPAAGDALMVVDVQYDFLPGGALGVAGGDRIIPALNRYIEQFAAAGLPIVISRDWHPRNHSSFEAHGGPWPPHCVAGTHGAEFSSELRMPESAWIISKATDPAREAYSAFQGTDLEARLRAAGVTRLFIGGLATEYCVKFTVDDAMARGFRVCVLEDAIRSIDVEPGDGARAIDAMHRSGAESVVLGAPRS